MPSRCTHDLDMQSVLQKKAMGPLVQGVGHLEFYDCSPGHFFIPAQVYLADLVNDRVQIDLNQFSEKAGKVRAGDMAQVVEHLPSKCKVLNSNPSAKREKRAGKVEHIYMLRRSRGQVIYRRKRMHKPNGNVHKTWLS
jgi:hypothetical protein